MAALTAGVVRPEPTELAALIKAAALPGIGALRLTAAMERWNDPERAFRELAATVWPRLSAAERDRVRGRARRAFETVLASGIHVLTPTMPLYPRALRHVDPPPYLLFARGRLELLQEPMVAVVGTRRCSPAGRTAAARIAAGIAAAGVTVISGLARGVDGTAHRAAGAARTVAVVGSGVDVWYPVEHRDLQEAIARDGLVLSEQLPGAPAAAHHFPRRNRMIVGLARGVVVVEAPPKSGALITAKLAYDNDIKVFAVPGSLATPTAEGSNALLRDGAVFVTSAAEVLAELELPLPPEGWDRDRPPPELEGVALALWRAMSPEPRHADDLAGAIGLDPGESLASLLALEIRGHARQYPGLRFARANRADADGYAGA